MNATHDSSRAEGDRNALGSPNSESAYARSTSAKTHPMSECTSNSPGVRSIGWIGSKVMEDCEKGIRCDPKYGPLVRRSPENRRAVETAVISLKQLSVWQVAIAPVKEMQRFECAVF